MAKTSGQRAPLSAGRHRPERVNPVRRSGVGSGVIGDVTRIVGQAWDLDEVARRYHDFVDRFQSIRPHTAGEAFQAQIRLVQEWRRFPFLDPALPPDLHPTPRPATGSRPVVRRGCRPRWRRGVAVPRQ